MIARCYLNWKTLLRASTTQLMKQIFDKYGILRLRRRWLVDWSSRLVQKLKGFTSIYLRKHSPHWQSQIINFLFLVNYITTFSFPSKQKKANYNSDPIHFHFETHWIHTVHSQLHGVNDFISTDQNQAFLWSWLLFSKQTWTIELFNISDTLI